VLNSQSVKAKRNRSNTKKYKRQRLRGYSGQIWKRLR